MNYKSSTLEEVLVGTLDDLADIEDFLIDAISDVVPLSLRRDPVAVSGGFKFVKDRRTKVQNCLDQLRFVNNVDADFLSEAMKQADGSIHFLRDEFKIPFGPRHLTIVGSNV